VHAAVDGGVNLIDTAPAYGTEEIVGTATAGNLRSRIIISTKVKIGQRSGRLSGPDLRSSLENSLRRLRTDYVDLLLLHALERHEMEYAESELFPALDALRAEGKVRYLGMSESGPNDPGHTAISRALASDVPDVYMVAFHLLHQSARTILQGLDHASRPGFICMFAVRNIFRTRESLVAALRALAAEGLLQRHPSEPDPVELVTSCCGPGGPTDLAYRFALGEPGIDTVLTGTGNIEHLRANIASLAGPALDERLRRGLCGTFGSLPPGIGLDFPDTMPTAHW
jgi:L-galactose dehydrogenase